MQNKQQKYTYQSVKDRVDQLAHEAMQRLHTSQVEAEPLIAEALRLAGETAPDDFQVAFPALVMQGILAANAGDYQRAAAQLLKVMSFDTTDVSHKHWQMQAMRFLVICNHHMAYFTEGLEWAQRWYTLAESVGDSDHELGAQRAIATLYSFMGQHTRSIESFERLLDKALAANDSSLIASFHNNMTLSFIALDQPEEALYHAEMALQGFEKAGNVNGIIAALNNIATGALLRHDTTTALAATARSVELAQTNSSQRFLAISLTERGRVLLASGDVEAALDVLAEARTHAQNAPQAEVNDDIDTILADVYTARGDFAAACDCYKRLYERTRRKAEQQTSARFAYMATIFETRQAVREAELQRRRAEEIEARAEQERQYFKQLNQMKDHFVSAATHDLKNPLATIRIYADLLKMQVPLKLHTYIEKIDIQTVRMSQLIMEMLDLARLETGHALNLQQVVLVDLLRDVIDTHNAKAAERNVNLLLDATDVTSNLKLDLDPQYMRRAFDNLILNAIKYTYPDSTVQVTLNTTADTVHILFIDNGPGIAAEYLPHLFERFYRVVTKENQYVEGTGLGLAITQTIIEQHNGQISVESTEGEGTTFTIVLPQ